MGAESRVASVLRRSGGGPARETKPETIWVIVKIMVPFWVP